MVILLVVSLALAGEPPPPPASGEGGSAPASGSTAAPASGSTAAPASGSTAAPASGSTAAPATPAAPPPASAPPIFDVEVVKKGTETPVNVAPAPTAPAAGTPTPPAAGTPTAPAAGTPTAPAAGTPTPPPPIDLGLGGNITPPPAPVTGPPPPPPTEAPPGFVPPAPIVSVAAPAGPPPPPEPGVGLRITGTDTWRVKDAAGHRYTSVQFARIVGDTATLQRMSDRREFGKIAQTTAAITGGGLLVASLIVVTSTEGQPDLLDYSVDPTLYDTKEEYEVATDFEKGQYDKAVASWQSQRLGTALFLAGAGGLVLGSSPFIGRDNDRRAERPDLVYQREEAQGWVEKYNAAHPLAGAPPADAAAAPAPAVDPAAAPAAPDPAGDDDPVTPDAPDGTAKPATPGAPLDLDDDAPAPKLRAHLLLGVGMVGVTGSF